MVSLYYKDSKPLLYEHVMVGVKVAIGLYLFSLLLWLFVVKHMIVSTLSLMVIGIYWVNSKDSQTVKINLISYFGLSFVLISILSPAIIYLELICLALSPLIVTIIDRDVGGRITELILSLGKYHYKSSVRVDKSPDFLLRLLTSFSYQFRRYSDLNLNSAELIQRVSKSKAIGRLVYNSAVPGFIWVFFSKVDILNLESRFSN